jgi:hypothetical protein
MLQATRLSGPVGDAWRFPPQCSGLARTSIMFRELG